MSNRLVEFTERVDGSQRAQKKAEEAGKADRFLVDPDHIGAIRPSVNYTSLLVDGRWIHIAHPLDEVMRMLGKDVW